MLTLAGRFLYDDQANAGDAFAREPYVAHWRTVGHGDFLTIPCHVTPSDVVNELEAIPGVIKNASATFGIDRVAVLGDFNADCTYLTAPELAGLELATDPGYVWLLGSEVDTTVSATDCAYDRIVVAGGLEAAVVSASVEVFRFDAEFGLNETDAKAVSDHYPVAFALFDPSGGVDGSEFVYNCPVVTFGLVTFGRTPASTTAAGSCAAGYSPVGAAPPSHECGATGVWVGSPQGDCSAAVWINELHYQNDGADVNEGAEVAAPLDYELDGFKLVKYNGNGGGVISGGYTFPSLYVPLGAVADGYTFEAVSLTGLQNGPDGLALLNPSGDVLQFLSWGGSFVATDGPAAGKRSADIGVTEPNVGWPATGSIALTGSGNTLTAEMLGLAGRRRSAGCSAPGTNRNNNCTGTVGAERRRSDDFIYEL